MTIKPVATGQGHYYVLLGDNGYPLAQGSRLLVEAAYQSRLRGDTREQSLERLKFYGVII